MVRQCKSRLKQRRRGAASQRRSPPFRSENVSRIPGKAARGSAPRSQWRAAQHRQWEGLCLTVFEFLHYLVGLFSEGRQRRDSRRSQAMRNYLQGFATASPLRSWPSVCGRPMVAAIAGIASTAVRSSAWAIQVPLTRALVPPLLFENFQDPECQELRGNMLPSRLGKRKTHSLACVEKAQVRAGRDVGI